jgi:aspartate kinase
MGAFEGDAEYDSVVSSGELVTSGLMAIALRNAGIKSRSYSSWQVPVFTDSNHGRAVIQNIDPANLQRDLENGIVPVVCGFQGISSENKITTLGRGGSDLTAVAVASAIKADLCEIYSDVDGVYTVDPNLYTEAKKIDSICYNEML